MAKYYNDTKFEDLTPDKQEEFLDTLGRLGKSREWGDIALKVNSVEDWEKYGFGGLFKEWLQKRVDRQLHQVKMITIDDLAMGLYQLREEIAQLKENTMPIGIDNEIQHLKMYVFELERRINALEARMGDEENV